MAWIRSSAFKSDSAGSATTIAVDEMPTHQTNDLILVFYGKDHSNGGTWSVTGATGFTQITNTQSAELNSASFYKVATSASETIPTGSQSDADELYCYVVVIADIDTADPINTSRVDTFADNTHTPTALSTDENNTLNLFFHLNDGSRYPNIDPGLMALDIPVPQAQSSQCSVSWTWQASSGTGVTPDFHLTQSDQGHIISVAVNSANTNPTTAPHCDYSSPPTTIIHPLRSTNTTGDFGGGSVDPSSDLTGGIGPNSETFNYLGFGGQFAAGVDGTADSLLLDTPSSTSANEIWGGIWNLSAGNVNLSGKKICCHFGVQSSAYWGGIDSVANGGIIFGVRTDDGGGNAYRFWNASAINSKPTPLAQHAGVFEVDDATLAWDDVGTVDETAVSGLFMGFNKGGAVDTRVTYAEVHALNDVPIIGGSATVPATLETFLDSLKASKVMTINSQGGSSTKQLFSMQSMQVGDGSVGVHFLEDNASLEFAKTADAGERKLQYNAGDNSNSLTFYGVSGDTISFTNSAISGETVWDFTIHASSTSAATWNFSGLAIINADVTLRDVFTAASSISFINCPTFTLNSADLSGGCTFDNTLVTITSSTELADVANCTFRNRDGAGESAILITGNQSGTWSDPGISVSNNTYDIEYTGTTDFTIESATSLTVNNSGSGTLTIDTPTVSLTVNSSEASSDIKIFETGTQTIETSATGTSASTTVAATYDWTVQKAGFLPQRGTGVVLGATSVTVDVTLVEDPIYNGSHGLTFTTDYSYNASTRVMTIVANQEGRDLYSALIDDFISETSLRNCPFPLVAVGPDRIDFTAVGYYNSATTVGATIDSGDITFWKGAGMEWEHDTTGNPTKKFYSIKSSNTLQAGTVVGYTQVVTGTPSACTLVSNKVNQVIQFFEDTNGDGTADYNYTGHLLFKGFQTGYYQARWDVINDGGVTTLEPYEYNISLLQDAIAGTTGDQSISIATLTDHTSSPLSVGGKSFDYELVDPGTNDADDLLAQLNYDVYNAVNTSISGTLYTSYQAFDLPDLVVEAGSNVETERGYFEGDGAVTDLSGVYLSRSSADHPGIARFQSNDGTYYTPAVTANISITGMPTAGGSIRLQLHNETAKTASAWAGTTAYSQGDKVLRSTGVGSEQTAGLYFVATTGGTSGASEPTWDTTVGNTTADGTVTWTCYAILYYDADPGASGYSDSYTNLEEFSANDTYRVRFAELNGTTSFKTFETTGIASSSGITVVVSTTEDSVYATNAIDGSSTAVTNIYTADYTNSEIDLDADLDFTNPKTFAFYCYELTTSQGMYQIWGGVTAIDSANYRNNTDIVSIMLDETAGFVKQEDSDTSRWFRSDGSRPYKDPTTGGNGIAVNWKNPVYTISTGSVLTAGQQSELSQAAQAATVNSKIGTPDTDVSADLAAIDALIDAIKAKTDQLTFSKTNELDANIKSVTDATINGSGTELDPWGP